MAEPAGRSSDVEARRILDRVAAESEAGGLGNRLRGHLTAADVDPSDRIEYWGTRVGRSLGLLITIAILATLVVYLSGG